MKIAMFAWETLHSKAVGGIAPHVTELAAGLCRLGNEVHVFCPGNDGQACHEEIFGVRYHRIWYDGNGDMIDSMERMSNAMIWVFGETAGFIGGFDIAHCHDWMTCKALVQCKNSHNLPCVFTFHSTERGRSLGGGEDRVVAVEGEAAFVADRIIAVSEKFKGEVMCNYNLPDSKVWAIVNGIQCAKFDGFIDCGEVKGRYGIGTYDPVVLFVGRMVGGMKGVDVLFDAAPDILSERWDAKIVFVGEGDQKQWFENLAWERGLGDQLRFLGAKRGEELVDLYKACDVVCIPSRNEPFGLVVLEAWAAGKPVVVSDQVGCPVSHGGDGYVVSCCPEGVAWGVKEIFRNFEHARTMGNNGRGKAAFTFSWDVVAKTTLECYKDTMGCRGW